MNPVMCGAILAGVQVRLNKFNMIFDMFCFILFVLEDSYGGQNLGFAGNIDNVYNSIVNGDSI